jgi:hypothetical protein
MLPGRTPVRLDGVESQLEVPANFPGVESAWVERLKTS